MNEDYNSINFIEDNNVNDANNVGSNQEYKELAKNLRTLSHVATRIFFM